MGGVHKDAGTTQKTKLVVGLFKEPGKKQHNRKVAMAKYTITEGIIMALTGYVLTEWPTDHGRVSREWVEPVFWADK